MPTKPSSLPAQHQGQQPGLEAEMTPPPEYIRANYRGRGKLDGKVALITGGDSGIGRAVAGHFARADADVAIATPSINAYRGNPQLVDYTATKGAITAYIRSIVQQLAEKKIRANTVAPGPIWTPLIPASFSAKQVAKFG